MDLTLAILVIGVLAAAAIPKFFDALDRHRAAAAAQRIRADLEYARNTAISRSTSLVVAFSPASSSYSIAGLANLDRASQSYSVALNGPPYNAILVSATLGADTNVQFDRFGMPDSGGTITVASGAHQQTVTLNAQTGKASIP